MLRSSCPRYRRCVAGFYVAVHPWLAKEGLCKVGFSTDVGKRLHMSNYITCFSDEWKYAAVLQCKRKDARLLEFATLKALHSKRLSDRELVYMSPDKVVRLAQRISKLLKISCKTHLEPSFAKPKTKPAKQQVKEAHQLQTRIGNVLEKIESITKEVEAEQSASPVVRQLLPATEPASSLSKMPQLDKASTQHTDAPLVVDNGEEADVEVLREMWPLSSPAVADKVEKVELRDYQLEASHRATHELTLDGKTIVQMACRSGKTPVAHAILHRIASQHPSSCRILFLVPGLSLLRQTAQKLSGYGLPHGMTVLLIGSDPQPVVLAEGQMVTMTTNPVLIEETLRTNTHVLAVSTYLSSETIMQAANRLTHSTSGTPFHLTIFDEAHRVCGRSDPAPYNAALLAPQQGQRLFLTATPTYDTPIRMDNRSFFGSIAYRFYLREAIDKSVVNNFEVQVVLGDVQDDMTGMVLRAMECVDKLLVFCKNIAHAEKLCKEVNSALAEGSKSELQGYECFAAHSRLGPVVVNGELNRFRSAKKAVLFNVRLFQEGVEIPDLNGVMFASPRYSPRDIIQSICRPLNKLPLKPISKVFIPAHYDKSKAPDDPVNLGHFSTLVPFTDALISEDASLFEYLIDPTKNNYNIRVIGARSLKISDGRLQNVVLPWIRRGVRFSKRDTDRLQNPAVLPWKSAFAELQRIVLECNRYPKHNDAWIIGTARIPLHRFYRYVREGYRLHLAGQPTYLEAHQIRDLESLNMWHKYGLYGPYPWKECFETLRKYVEEHKRFPLLEIHKGGYIGLDATPFERLAGALCNINQQDGNRGLCVSEEKQRDMDVLCNKFGLRWRKLRKPDGSMRSERESSCITDCYDEFKRRFEKRDSAFMKYLEKHFPGYPEKHKRMESLGVQAAGTAPPRLKLRSPAQIKRMKSKGISDIAQHVVVCRQCRVEVEIPNWDAHLASKEHLSRST